MPHAQAAMARVCGGLAGAGGGNRGGPPSRPQPNPHASRFFELSVVHRGAAAGDHLTAAYALSLAAVLKAQVGGRLGWGWVAGALGW